MRQNDIFGAAKWLCAGVYANQSAQTLDSGGVPHFPILRSRFTIHNVKKATLYVLGLGFFHCYLNGREVTEDAFLPLSTNYELRQERPIHETVTGHRIYVPNYDVTSLLADGENVLALHFGGGWYTFEEERYGDPKAIFRLNVETDAGTIDFYSTENDKIGDSYVKTYYFTRFENQDFTAFDDSALTKELDDSAWSHAELAKPVDTEYLFCDCPADRVEEFRPVVCLAENGDEKSYDSGRNCSAVPVLKLHAKKSETVTVIFSEEQNEDGTPDMDFHHMQSVSFVSDGKERIVQSMFTWFGFRYFTVKGDAEPIGVKVLHTDVKVTAAFESDNETLDWIYKAFLNTQLSNMHAGIPSDCPHLERRGYTGDGQLVCHAAMNALDARSFYHKWISDIGDCQDIYSGHVQYTAPYTHSGGGPGGWGCAIIEVPYQYYKHYGDAEPLSRLYAQMLRYFDYLESHSADNLICRDKEGEWCLGDWCAPIQVILPAAFVNNYFYIKSLHRMIEIAKLVGREYDIPIFEARIQVRKDAVMAAFYNTWDGNFIGNLQGANAFAVDMGLGDQRTYDNLVRYYQELGRYDTGIFGTDIVTRVLFEHGDGELAVKLLLSNADVSFEGMRRAGATTLWENWPHATWDRSRNHPMFGAVSAYLFDYLLGIRQETEIAGYSEIVIAPVLGKTLNRLSGKRVLPQGEVSVSYEKNGGQVDFVITLPDNLPAVFRFGGHELKLHAGENQIRETIES